MTNKEKKEYMAKKWAKLRKEIKDKEELQRKMELFTEVVAVGHSCTRNTAEIMSAYEDYKSSMIWD